jgi:membrane protein YdbS with pleckstrin-like domain
LKFKSEPVLVTHAVAAVLGWIASFLVLHGVIGGAHASSLVQEITPTLVSAALLAIGVFVRAFVAPVVKETEADIEKFVHDHAPAFAPAVDAAAVKVDAAVDELVAPAGPSAA